MYGTCIKQTKYTWYIWWWIPSRFRSRRSSSRSKMEGCGSLRSRRMLVRVKEPTRVDELEEGVGLPTWVDEMRFSRSSDEMSDSEEIRSKKPKKIRDVRDLSGTSEVHLVCLFGWHQVDIVRRSSSKVVDQRDREEWNLGQSSHKKLAMWSKSSQDMWIVEFAFCMEGTTFTWIIEKAVCHIVYQRS
jgi:hypothetical protein